MKKMNMPNKQSRPHLPTQKHTFLNKGGYLVGVKIGKTWWALADPRKITPAQSLGFKPKPKTTFKGFNNAVWGKSVKKLTGKK